MIAGFYRSRI